MIMTTLYVPRIFPTLGYSLTLLLALLVIGCRSRHQSAERHQSVSHTSALHSSRERLGDSVAHTRHYEGQSSVLAIEEVELWQTDSLYGSPVAILPQQGTAPSLGLPLPLPLAPASGFAPVQRWRRVYRLRESYGDAASHSATRQASHTLAEQSKQTAIDSSAHERRTSRRSSAPLVPRLWWLILALWCGLAWWTFGRELCSRSSLKLRPMLLRLVGLLRSCLSHLCSWLMSLLRSCLSILKRNP